MNRLETIERKIAGLSPPELAEFRDWFIEFDAQQWDRKFEKDAATGRLDSLADAALKGFHAGKCTEL